MIYPTVLLFTLLITATALNAQSLIAVQNGGTPKFYEQLTEAINNSNDGDTLYIPGGSFSLSIAIDKRLHLIGVGYHPDSTIYTNPTVITGNLVLITGASGGSITGVNLKGSVVFGENETNGDVNHYEVSRCIFDFVICQSVLPAYNSFIQNVMNNTAHMNGTCYNMFFNNIITNGPTKLGLGSTVKNNIMFGNIKNEYYYHYSDTYKSNNTVFENNIIYSYDILYYGSNNIYKNNLFPVDFDVVSPNQNCIYSNNQSSTTVFVNHSGTIFDFTNDYHLKSDSPGKNAGTDGTDIGIYGGTFPWKEGSVPSNPHFQSVQISGKTDNSGKLNVKIKVAAQER